MSESKILVPPNSKESEMMVLGSMLTSVNSLNVAADALDSLDFYYTEHQIIFDVLKTAYKSDKPADVHLVCEELKRQGKLKAIGGAAYVTSLAQYAGTSAFIEEYAEVVQNKAILRRMIHAAHDMEKNAIADPSDVHALLDDAQQKLFVISQSTHSQGGVLVKDILSGVKAAAKIPFLKELQERQENFKLKGPEDAGITGLPTHFLDLDKMINGLGSSNFIILAARPAMGKCVTGDTQIVDPVTGALRCIKDLVAQGSGHVATLSKDWTLRPATPSAFIADGIKPTFKLTTALGKEIEATAVHPLLTINGWKRLEELKVGERIATPRALPYFGKKTWPEHELIALAYFIADGSLTQSTPEIIADVKKAISSFEPASLELLQILKQKFDSAINALTGPMKNTYSLAHAGFTNASLQEEFSFSSSVKSNPAADWLTILDLPGKDTHEKSLPLEIFELTKANITLLINRLFAYNNTSYNPSVITHTSASKTLVHQLHHLLLRFGILSKISPSDKILSSFELEIQGKDNLTKFCNEIGIFAKEHSPPKILDHALADEEEKSDVYWDKIISIESTGEKEVFDLTVDETHNFIAGDIIVHNTAFAVNIAENLCFKSGLPVGIFSLEMTAEQLLHRLICSQSEVESDKLRTGNLSGSEFQRIVAAVNSMQKATMVIDDQPGLKITDLRARARRMKETHGIQFLVIDYLQLISGSGNSKSAENRQNEISEISRMLKNLARELNIPVVCLSQLSRKVEERPGHRPMMSDLRESGSLEQDSDVVIFLLRREYYDPYDKPGLAEVIVAKNRHGGVGSVFLTFRKELAQFANYSASLDTNPSGAPKEDAFSAFTPH